MIGMEIPLFLWGEEKKGSDISLDFHNRITVNLPAVRKKDLRYLREHNRAIQEELQQLSVDEILNFIEEARKLWESDSYFIKREGVDMLSRVTGYSREMIELHLEQVMGMMTREYWETTLNSELGDMKILDEWCSRGEASVHCLPRGNVCHVLAGNAPLVSVISILRGLVTKNCNIIKMSSREPLMPYFLIKTFRDINKYHPLARANTVLYWKGGEEIEKDVVNMGNTVFTWGGEEALKGISRHLPYYIDMVRFGPRRGVQLISLREEEEGNLRESTDPMAHDLTLIDQEACFSPQVAFVEGDVDKFAESLAESLERENEKYPKGPAHEHKHVEIAHLRKMSVAEGKKVHHSGSFDWTLIISDEYEPIKKHPLGRVLFIFKVNDIREAIKYLDSSVQTVALHPRHRISELRKEIVLQGVDRVTHLGKMGYFAAGAPHDGTYPLMHLVRWVKSKL